MRTSERAGALKPSIPVVNMLDLKPNQTTEEESPIERAPEPSVLLDDGVCEASRQFIRYPMTIVIIAHFLRP